MKKKIIIYGISDFAKLLTTYLQEVYEIECYTVEKKYITTDVFLGKPVVPFENIEEKFSPNMYSFFVAVGYSQINKVRERIFLEIKEKHYSLVSYIHPTSIISKDVNIKDNTFIFENVVIQPFSKVEENIVIWSNATICHDCIIEKNCFIGSNACVNGFVKIGKNTFIGANSTIRNNITIGKYNIIGAGCTILGNTCSNSVYKSLEVNRLDIAPEKIII